MSPRLPDAVVTAVEDWPLSGHSAEVFLAALFGKRRGHVVLCRRRRDGRWCKELPFRWPVQSAELIEAAMRLAVDHDVYVTPLLHTAPKRAKANAGRGTWLWTDLDDDMRGDVDELLADVPVMAVASGTPDHWHVYVPLAKPESADVIERLNRQLATALGGEKWSRESVLRLPGTLSHKVDPPEPVTLVQQPSGTAGLTVQQVEEIFGGADPSPAHTPDNLPVPTEPSRPLPKHLADALEEEPSSDRSRQSYEFQANCVEYGFTDDEVAWLALHHQATQAKYGSEERILDDVARTLAELRPKHPHVGRPCDEASCANRPAWMSSDEDDGVKRELRRLRTYEEARRILRAEQALAEFTVPPSRFSLVEELAVEDDPLGFTIDALHPTGANTLLAAQYKVGKTTLVGNACRSLADGGPFLGAFDVVLPEDGRVAFLNYELTEAQCREWFRRLRIRRPERVWVLNLRGYRLPLLAEPVVDWLVDELVRRQVRFLILDPWARAFSGSGDENSNTDVGYFLETLDVIKQRAGVADLILTSHTGRKEHAEGAEHVRGATRLDDWADVRWVLTRQGDDRFLAADGRDVDVPESRLVFEPETLRLGLCLSNGGSRDQVRRQNLQGEVLRALRLNPGLGVRQLRVELSGHRSADVDGAVEALIAGGEVDVVTGPNNKRSHYLAGKQRPLADGKRDERQGALL